MASKDKKQIEKEKAERLSHLKTSLARANRRKEQADAEIKEFSDLIAAEEKSG